MVVRGWALGRPVSSSSRSQVPKLLLPVLLPGCRRLLSWLAAVLSQRLQQQVLPPLWVVGLPARMAAVLCSWQGLQSQQMTTSMKAQQQQPHLAGASSSRQCSLQQVILRA